MKKTCIIFYQHIVREYDMCSRVKRDIEELSEGRVEARIFSLDFEWTEACRYAANANLVAVLLPWMRLRQHESLIAPFVKLNPNVLLIDFDHEQTGFDESDPASKRVCENRSVPPCLDAIFRARYV